MPRIGQKRAVQGSQYWLQEYCHLRTDMLDDDLRRQLELSDKDSITWLSPLEDDGYAEYRDKAFLERLSVHLDIRDLKSFWPRGGPVWDGLAQTSRGDIILVEAKSHIPELVSSCQAEGPALELIKNSLAETAAFYGADSAAGWLEGYYQYANRLAHLYLLRHVNKVPAWLVFVCFVNDFDMAGPTSADGWKSGIEDVHAHLGIKRVRLAPHVVDLFPDVTRVGQ